MLSRLTGIAVFALSVGMFLASVADAKTTYKCVFHSKQTAVSIGASFTFDGKTENDALSTGSGTSVCPAKPILGGAFTFQGVSETSTGDSSCSFTGVFGEAETGVDITLIGSASALDGALGATFYAATVSGSGCLSLTTGAFTFTEVDALFAGTGVYKNATGISTYTSVGFTLAPSAGGTGFFQWSRTNGKVTITFP